jgi:hypothetical protein
MNKFNAMLKTLDHVVSEYKLLLRESIISPSLKKRIFKLTFIPCINNITEYYYENKISIDKDPDSYLMWNVVSFLEDNTIEQLQKLIETTNFKFEISLPDYSQTQIITCKGCIEDQPNQLAHCDEGGCMHGYF